MLRDDFRETVIQISANLEVMAHKVKQNDIVHHPKDLFWKVIRRVTLQNTRIDLFSL